MSEPFAYLILARESYPSTCRSASKVKTDASGEALDFMRIPLPLLVVLSALTAGCTTEPPSEDGAEPQRPSRRQWNVVMIQWDATRADALGCYGDPSARTPRVDQLAREGVRFDQAFVNAPYTASSVPSLMSGNYQDLHGLRYQGTAVRPESELLAERFKAAGYQTAAFVSNGVLGHRQGHTQGFDHFKPLSKSPATDVVDHAIQWMQGRDENAPFFLWIFLVDPHFPYLPPDDFAALHDVGDVESSYSWRRTNGKGFYIGKLFWGGIVSDEEARQERALYAGELSYVDSETGRLLDQLDTLELADDTMVVFTSDHGEEFGERDFYFCHGFTGYEGGLRVPLIFRLPRQPKPGRAIEQVVRAVDVAPTVLDIVELPTEGIKDGRSLLPLVVGARDEMLPIPAYFESSPLHEGFYKDRPRIYLTGPEGSWRGLRTEDWKLIKIPHPDGPQYELYDMTRDPAEEQNLATAQPDVLDKLKTTLEAIEIRTMALGDDWDSLKVEELDAQTRKILESLGYIG